MYIDIYIILYVYKCIACNSFAHSHTHTFTHALARTHTRTRIHTYTCSNAIYYGSLCSDTYFQFLLFDPFVL